ncbi:hypothetical protein Mapa_014931 [Marchantia paleacea]|nr:hypothetical protein Mapa_014931 [Marchantia paleacea]
MGRLLSEVLAPEFKEENEALANARSEEERLRKRKRAEPEGDGGGPGGGGGGRGLGRNVITFEDRMKEINRILQVNYESDEDDDDLEELYQDLYQHLVHFPVLDFTNKESINVFTLGMALQIGPLAKLEILELGMQVGSEEEMESLADAIDMGHLPSLKFLNVSEIQFDDCDQVGVKALSRALSTGFNFLSLEQLHLVENDICDEGIKALSLVLAGGYVASLKHLNLRYNHIGPDGAKHLALALESGQVPRLIELELSRNCIGDEGAEALSRALTSGKLRGLDTLGLWMNDIEVKGATALARALESGNLPALTDLGILDFDDDGTKAIVRCFSLGHVRSLEKVHFEHIEKQTAVDLAKSVLEPGHLPNLQELRLTYMDLETVEAFILAYENNGFLVAELQVDWDSSPQVQRLEDRFNQVRDRNIRFTQILTAR